MAAQTGLCLAWLETPEDTFCRVVAHLNHGNLPVTFRLGYESWFVKSRRKSMDFWQGSCWVSVDATESDWIYSGFHSTRQMERSCHINFLNKSDVVRLVILRIFFRGDLVMKNISTAIYSFPLIQEGSCQLLAKTKYSTGKLPRRFAQDQCAQVNWPRSKWP